MSNPEAVAFNYAVYEEVQKIPYGKVTSYGHIAKMIYKPENPRQVGMALKRLTSDESQLFHLENVPWWRVINSQGKISIRATAAVQASRLRAEDVDVTSPNYSIDLEEHGWFPATDFDYESQ